ncbi:DUF2946 domain-containing protein [Chimaeribacter californicus]|uniref:DUF2946 domain-containing protein n=1 Tax=Chimaeribacter californicus TaxID=2060067 RepID=A0A2N5DYG2_9GAMM|nr:DUF2946 domain-containing protein [Chimaeribacter californicus]PLR32613.1 DUF2946 domain-containing protein [Chimaeribacter californicus]
MGRAVFLTLRPSARHRITAAWLGIFALLLLFVAPVISTSLAQTHARTMAMPGMMMPMDTMAMDHDTMGHDAMAAGDMPMTHPAGVMPDQAACGYCVLLAHAPLLEMALPLLAWFTLLAARTPPPRRRLRLPPPPPLCRPRTRAPPVLLISL